MRLTPQRGKIVNGNEWDIAIYSKPILGRKYEMVIDPAFGGEEADNTSVRVLDKNHPRRPSCICIEERTRGYC